MRYSRSILLLVCLFGTIHILAQECFKLELSNNTTHLELNRQVMTSNTKFKFPMESRSISGLSLSGTITKKPLLEFAETVY